MSGKDGEFKLYVWHNVLGNYGPGIAFALARSREEALTLIQGACLGNGDTVGTRYRSPMKEFHEAPFKAGPIDPDDEDSSCYTVHTSPVAYALEGSS